jgi:hypothetical protein
MAGISIMGVTVQGLYQQQEKGEGQKELTANPHLKKFLLALMLGQ